MKTYEVNMNVRFTDDEKSWVKNYDLGIEAESVEKVAIKIEQIEQMKLDGTEILHPVIIKEV